MYQNCIHLAKDNKILVAKCSKNCLHLAKDN